MEKKESIENIKFEIVGGEQKEEVKKDVMDLLHEYPQNFIHGWFEKLAEQDYKESDIAVAYDGNVLVGSFMFNRVTNEYTWLAIKKGIPFSKPEIAKRLIEGFYPTIKPGAEVHLFVNTEDASSQEHPDFTGKSFDPARRFYRSMGFELKEENIEKDKFGTGAHAYKVAWTPNNNA